jgi:hypothetical protein
MPDFSALAATASPFNPDQNDDLKMKQKAKKHVPVAVFHVNENLSLEEQIAQRAHELWQQRGGRHGNDMDDWFRAEREINDWHHQRQSAVSHQPSP